MTRDQFIKKSWRSFSEIHVIYPENNWRHETKIECMVMGVDFENETIKVCPFPDSDYKKNSFWVSFVLCHTPRRKLKVS